MPFPRLSQLRQLPTRAYVQLSIGLLIAVGTLIGFSKIVNEIFEQETKIFDQNMYQWTQTWASPPFDTLMLWMTFTGAAVSMVGLSVAVLLWLYFLRHNLHAIRLFMITNLGGITLNYVLKIALQRDRPLIAADIGAIGYSLPSGHAMAALIFYGFLGYLLVRSQRDWVAKVLGSLLCLTFIALIGLSRVYLQAHYASDVAAGYAAGAFWLSTCILALKAKPWYQKYRPDQPDEIPGDEKPQQPPKPRPYSPPDCP
jgi:undecaprenyl-diphosphatase